MIVYILFILGFVFLIKGADYLVEGSASIAKKFNISSIVIGLTIVAFGTSAPEFIVNIFASLNGNTEIAIGNILGSNIANIFLVLGVLAVIYPLVSKKDTVWKEIPFSLLAVVVLGILVNDIRIDNDIVSVLTRIDGLILILFFTIFLYYTFNIAQKSSSESNDNEIIVHTKTRSIIYIIIGLIGLALGGKWIVDGAVKIAEMFNLSQSLIGLTVIAVGTSLPELATSIVAAYKKHTDIAIGNIVGSNIFNVFWVLGISSIIKPLPFSAGSDIDIFTVIFASLLLFVFMFLGKKHTIERWQGVVMVLMYIVYLIIIVNLK